jgi:hypothetical protein
MVSHLRFAGLPDTAQRQALRDLIAANSLLMEVLSGLREAALPDCWLVSGAIYNEVWNALTGRPALTGIKDIDIAYFDARDLSYEAEDRVIRGLAARFAHLPIPVEPRNQARVHLWFESRFGFAVPPLSETAEALGRYASRTHAVGARLEPDGRISLLAPFGLDDMFSFRLRPNRRLDNRLAHERKAARAKAIWPELLVEPW